MSEFTKEEIEEVKLSNHIASRKIAEFEPYILLLEKTLGIHKTGSKTICKTKREVKDLLKEKEEKERSASATHLSIAEEVELIETRVAKASEKAV